MTRQRRSQVASVCGLVSLAAVLALVPAGLERAVPDIAPRQSGPDPFAPTEGNRPPRPGPTTVPLPPAVLDKSRLIIQQNPECWSGIPGRTCDPSTRTYR